MGSERNKNDDSATSYQPSPPSLCTNKCGFFGSATTKGLCSKCHRDLRMQEENKAAFEKSVTDLKQMFSSLEVDSQSCIGSSMGSVFPALSVYAGAEKVFALARERSEPCRPNRCGSCNKKVGLTTGFQCKCGITYCGTHRYPEAHECSFDFKASGRDEIAKANPVIKADKLSDRI